MEVPAAALTLDKFESADFFSFGRSRAVSCRLATRGCRLRDFPSQGGSGGAAASDQAAKLAGSKRISICGEMAEDPSCTADLLAAGIRHFSVAPTQLAYNSAHRIMTAHGLRIERSLVGTYATSLDMQGLSITLAFLTEEEFSLWDSPVATAALRWGC
ncbi:dihydroxyacetone kinase subunit DhaK [Rhizobium grahamii]|uniref:dihydroxyacetone kinase subunit DhaK n=1 Tax=Rhizobium grahamii TaxID=1120045 RepID=UPI0002D35B00